MPRIAGVNIPEQKRIEIALTYIYGIGRSLSKKILMGAKIDHNRRASDLTPEEVNKLRDIIEKEYKKEGELRRDIMMNIKRLREISSWRGTAILKGCRFGASKPKPIPELFGETSERQLVQEKKRPPSSK